MACHYSPEGKETSCVGYLAVEGYSNLNVRLLAAAEVIPMRQIVEDCKGLDLYGSFGEMLADFEAAS